MSDTRSRTSPPVSGGPLLLLLGAAHPLPALAVTALAGLLAAGIDLPVSRIALVTVAVLTGQLSIGWSNDLIDLQRDRTVQRPDKPLATGALAVAPVRIACVLAVVLTVPLGLACGIVAGLAHLVTTAAGWSYNLGLKATGWSWAPYAVGFGGLPVFVSLAGDPGTLPQAWLPLAGALLGVGAHFLNVLPDLRDDALTGVRGLPHRLGAPRSRIAATVALVGATVVIVVGAGVPAALALVSLFVVCAMAVVALTGRGKAPFLSAIGIALVDVVMLVTR